MAQNSGGSNQTLPVGSLTVKSLTVKVPYTGTYNDIKCLYGADENYGNIGSISDNICTFLGTAGNQPLYYKLIASNNDGKTYENSGTVTTGSETNVITTDIPMGTKAIIYLDPTDLSATCNEANSTIGSGTSGCMRWYAFKEDSSSYTMILDHNTSSAAWNSSGGSVMREAKSALETDTAGWQGSPRLITKSEVTSIEGVTVSGTKHTYYYIDKTTNWLSLGGMYWTSNYSSSYNCAWYVRPDCSASGGCMTDKRMWTAEGDITVSTVMGVRPVITVPKSSL